MFVTLPLSHLAVCVCLSVMTLQLRPPLFLIKYKWHLYICSIWMLENCPISYKFCIMILFLTSMMKCSFWKYTFHGIMRSDFGQKMWKKLKNVKYVIKLSIYFTYFAHYYGIFNIFLLINDFNWYRRLYLHI